VNLQKLRNYLVSSCRYIQTETGVTAPEHSSLWVEWVVARSLCVSRAVETSGVKAGELDALLALQVRQWAPFPNPEYHYQDMGNRLLVWAWDGDLRRRRCGEAGVRPDVVLPETLARPLEAPQHDPELVPVACWQGVEARAFRGGRLVQSRWWPEMPSVGAWNRARLLLDLPPLDTLPEPAMVTADAEQSTPLRHMLIPFLKAESTLFVLFFALFMVVSAYHLSTVSYVAISSARMESKIAELNSAVTPVLEARDAALTALDGIESLSALHDGPLQLQYLTDLMDRLASVRAEGQDVELVAWDFRPGVVSISVETEMLSPAELLSIFETVPWLREPRVEDDVVDTRRRVRGELVPGWRFPQAEPPAVAGR
jgi:hypothetical protein